MGSNIGPDSQTDSFGISAAAAALGSTAGTYVFRAECTDCERNKTVDFTINTVLPPDADSFSKEPPQSKVDQPSDPEHEIGALDVLFKSRNVFKRIDTSLVAGKPRQRIGVLRGDSVVFRAVSAPNAVSPSELVWSSDEPMGNGTGEEITVTFNSVGDISQTVQARNKSKTVKITVKDLSNVKHWDEFWDGRLLQKLKCGIFALILRLELLEGEVLELPLDLPDPEPVGQRRVDLQRLAGDAALLLGRQGLERAHVVEPVGELDEDDPDVLCHRQEHLPDVLGLLLLVGANRELRAQLRDAVDKTRDLGTEALLNVGHQDMLRKRIVQLGMPERQYSQLFPLRAITCILSKCNKGGHLALNHIHRPMLGLKTPLKKIGEMNYRYL